MQKSIYIKLGLFVLFAGLAISPLAAKNFLTAQPLEQTSFHADILQNKETQTRHVDLPINEQKNLSDEFSHLKQAISQPNITEQEIRQGWYTASKEGRKYGTPASWVFISDNLESRWTNPESLLANKAETEDDLCKQTGGYFDGTSNSGCICSDSTAWQDNQGCILKSSRGSLIAISQKEIEEGYYHGNMDEKKLNTPSTWKWVEGGENSNWHKP